MQQITAKHAEPLQVQTAAVEPGSFRDRCGRILYSDNRVFRLLSGEALAAWNQLSAKRFFTDAMTRGAVVKTELAPGVMSGALPISGDLPAGEWKAMLEHEKIPFISYAYEWSFGMLKDCALLQLELLENALNEGMILKDATPYNVQFRGSRPVFIDILSFEPLIPGQVWVGYRQFCELCLYPLMLQAFKRVPFQPWLRGDLEGISPEVFWNLLSFRDAFRPGVFKHVYLHSKLQNNFGDTRKDIKGALAGAGFQKEMILANVRSLRKLVSKISIPSIKTEWADYADTCVSYSEDNLDAKIQWIESVLKERRHELVWDIGCNTGTFSRIAAKNADYVIGSDIDHMAIERFYQALKSEGVTNILPLVSNIASPSPALGWRGLERKRMEERGRASLILALALIHHVVISANVPIEEFIEELARTGESLIIEFVTRDDPMVQKLLRNKVDQYAEYDLANFESCMERYFTIEKKHTLPSGNRVLYYGRRKG